MAIKGVIVGGGKSSRMGSDKAHILYKGVSLLQHARNVLLDLNIDDITVLGRPEEPDGIADKTPHAGPAISLQDWFHDQKKPYRVVVLPIDMPLLSPEHIEFLMKHEAGSYFDDLYLPFVATVNDSENARTARMKDLLAQLGLLCVKPPQNWKKILVNVNEPEDFGLLSLSN